MKKKNKNESKNNLISLSDLAIQVKEKDAKIIPLSNTKESPAKKNKKQIIKNKENE